MVEDDTPEPFGVWVYAVTRDLPQGHLVGVTGIGGAAVHGVRRAGLVAVVSPVNLAEFGEEPLRHNLEDLAWLETTAREHHQVVDAVSAAGSTVTMRLATVYRDDSRVAAMLAERRGQLEAALRHIEGRTEFGVKAYAEPAGPSDAAVESDRPGNSDAGPGTAYLLRRRAELATRNKQLNTALAAAETIHATLASLADATRRYVPQHPRLTGESATMVLNGAYLVAVGRVDEFVATVRTLDGRHPTVRLELTGPWPPYSFAAATETR